MLLTAYFEQWQTVTHQWTREWWGSRRANLLSSALTKLPVKPWTTSDPYETCGICIEDFIEEDQVRVFPCSHGQFCFSKLCRWINVIQVSYCDSESSFYFIPGFHSVCIEPWTTKSRGECPYCRQQVIPNSVKPTELPVFLEELHVGPYFAVLLVLSIALAGFSSGIFIVSIHVIVPVLSNFILITNYNSLCMIEEFLATLLQR